MLRDLQLRIHRGDGPVYSRLKRLAKGITTFSFTGPAFMKGPLLAVYMGQQLLGTFFRAMAHMFYRGPIFKARCERVGKNLLVWLLPDVLGPVRIYIGDDVKIFGHLGIMSSRVLDEPRLEIGDGVHLGHNVSITVNREVILEERCNIANGVRIVDSDAHPRNTEDRINGVLPPAGEFKPVRICRWAWLSADCMIMKGVTVGEGAVVGAGSIVVTDVPPYSVVMGNPARVVVKDTRSVLPPAGQPAQASEGKSQ